MAQESDTAPEKAHVLDTCLLLGRIMFHNGATVQRIIDSMNYLQEYFGGSEIHILVAYDAIVITDIHGSRFQTKIDQNREFAGTNIEALMSIRRLLKGLHGNSAPLEDVRQSLIEIGGKGGSVGPMTEHMVFGLTAVFFGVLNNGDIWTICSVFPSGILISWLRAVLTRSKFNLFVSTLLAAVPGVTLSCLLVKLIPTTTPLVAVIAPVLTMIPGFPLINGGIDILRNHNSVGLARLAFAAMLISTLTLAISVPLVLFFGTPRSISPVIHSHAYALLRDCISGCGAALLLGLIFNAPFRNIWMFGLGGAATLLIRTSALLFLGADVVTSTFLAAAGITVVTVFISRQHLLPPVLFAVICVLTMTPGFLIVRGLNDCFALSRMTMVGEIPYQLLAATIHTLLRAGLIVFAMITGVVFPVLIFEGRTPRV